MTDAESTVRFALRAAFIDTCMHTGLMAGPATDKLEDAIIVALTNPSLSWAIKAWVKELDTAE